jgi:hypothetical protein
MVVALLACYQVDLVPDSGPAWCVPDRETCNDIDDDCDGAIDEGAVDAVAWHPDDDGDGFGDADVAVLHCDTPWGWVSDGTDCDDADALVSPSATERCNGADDDCDGDIDEADALDATAWYADEDGDGYGGDGDPLTWCDPPTGFVPSNEDCDDADAFVHPNAAEACNERDDDCDGQTDEGVVPTWHADEDADGWGASEPTLTQCDAPDGYALRGGDCDDADATVNPGVIEVCNDVDDNCNGSVDEGDGEGSTTWYADADGDGYGDPDRPEEACVAPGGHVAAGTDCDDMDAGVHPGMFDDCGDGTDADCTDEDAACAIDGDLTAEDAVLVLRGDAAGEGAGGSVAAAGDLDGDGAGDLVVSGNGTAGPTIWVQAGETWGDASLGGADARWTGVTGDLAGQSAAGGGDFDGDGSVDLLIGAPGADAVATDAGAVYVVYGPLPSGAALLADVVNFSYEADGAGGALGTAVAVVADRDGDGTDEVLAGSPADGGGVAWLLAGPPVTPEVASAATAWFVAGGSGDRFGAALASVGDTDGDGLDDVAVGGPGSDENGSDAGGAWLFTGAWTGEIPAAEAEVTAWGDVSADGAGTCVAAAGDTDGDGYADWLVGAPGADDGAVGGGAVYLLVGGLSGVGPLSTLATARLGETADGSLGSSCAGAGDLDGDGYDDVVAGAPGGAGAVVAWYGPLAAGSATGGDAVIAGAGDDAAGSSVAMVGDRDGDGLDDLLWGAPGEATNGAGAGAAVLMLGGER